jgi:hypothetical protein
MRTWYYRALVALVCVSVAGCAEQPRTRTPGESLALLRAGRPVLTCREPCLAEWREIQPQAAQLDANARWWELSQLLVRVGYEDDLSLYYLGRAVEGIGHPGAAAGYYRQSAQLSGTSISCQHLSRVCGGVALPRASALQAARLERWLRPARPRRVEPAVPNAEAPPTGEEQIAPPMPGPVLRPAGPAASEVIEPPPARP